MWNNEWTYQKEIKETGTLAGGHAIKIPSKWKKDYLLLQNSYGEGIGEKGLHWVHRDIINKCFTYGALMFVDYPAGMTKEDILKISKISIMEKIAGLLKQVVSLYQQLIYKIQYGFRDRLAGITKPRSKDCLKAMREYKKLHPACEISGSLKDVEPHHVFPVHLFLTKPPARSFPLQEICIFGWLISEILKAITRIF